MKTFTTANKLAIANQTVLPRDLISFTVREFDTNNPVTFSMWSDLGNIDADVYNPSTGLVETRTFKGVGSLISIDPIVQVANLSVQRPTITCSAMSADVNSMFRNYNARQGIVELWRGFLDVDSRQFVGAAEPRFFGFLDEIEVNTAPENEESTITASCTSHSQEMTRFNPEYRSHSSQLQRDPTDNFLQDASSVAEWQMFWGKADAGFFIPTSAPSSGGGSFTSAVSDGSTSEPYDDSSDGFRN